MKLTNNKRTLFRVFEICLYIFIVVVLLLSVMSLFDLSAGRFALFMDEQISYDGISAILHSESLSDFILNVTTGFDGDLRYGRAFWNINALFAAPAFAFWGSTGQIIATRLIGLVALTLSYIILCRIAISNKLFRLLTISLLIILSTHLHYISMPKPEPLLLLTCAIFLWSYTKNQYKFGLNFWVLGFAWGLKISIAPLALIVGVISVISDPPKIGKIQVFWNNLILALFAFLIGWAICSPVIVFVLWPFILLTGALFLLTFQQNQNHSYPDRLLNKLSVRFRIFLGIIFLGILALLLFTMAIHVWPGAAAADQFNKILERWLNWVIGQAQAGGVSKESILSWFDLASEEYSGGSFWVLPALTVLGILGIYVNFANKNHLSSMGRKYTINASIIFIIGLFLNASIIFSVTRYWGFYLHPGMTFMIIGNFGIWGILVSRENMQTSTKYISAIRALAFITNGTIILSLFFYNVPQASSTVESIGSRTKQPGYISNINNYNAVIEILKQESEIKGEQLKVAYDPFLFFPETNHQWRVTPIWAGHVDWELEYDLLIVQHSSEKTGGSELALPDFTLEHVSTENSSNGCKVSPCYRIVPSKDFDGIVLQRIQN